jgi:ElaB/YqjD/DUF883 family membrane-anchored ribosome-binding protein
MSQIQNQNEKTVSAPIAAGKPAAEQAKPGGTRVKDALEQARAAAQELHRALSDATARRTGAVKADLEAIPQEVRALSASLKKSLDGESEAAKKHLVGAITHLESLQKHAAECMKSSGQAFETSVRHAVADARASVQKVSEALAEQRAAKPAQHRQDEGK